MGSYLILLDAYPLVAYITGEPPADEVMALLEDGFAGVPAINAAETLDVVCRVYGADPDDVERELDSLVAQDVLRVLPSTRRLAWLAGRLRLEHYHRRSRSLSIADCFLLASAGSDDAIATVDPAVLEVARFEGIATVALA